MARHPKEVTLSVATLYQRIAWLELAGMQEAADALRYVATMSIPVFRIDEAQIAAAKKKLQDYRDKPPLLD